MSQHSTKSPAAGKPQKPYDGFPAFRCWQRAMGQKIRGKHHHFGSWRIDSTGTAALEVFNQQ